MHNRQVVSQNTGLHYSVNTSLLVWLPSELQQCIGNIECITSYGTEKLSSVQVTWTTVNYCRRQNHVSPKYTIASHDGLSWSHDTQLSLTSSRQCSETGVHYLAGPLFCRCHHHIDLRKKVAASSSPMCQQRRNHQTASLAVEPSLDLRRQSLAIDFWLQCPLESTASKQHITHTWLYITSSCIQR